MPGWMYKKTKQPNLSTATYLADKGCIKGKKKAHYISETFQFKFTISLAILQRSYQRATVNLSTTRLAGSVIWC